MNPFKLNFITARTFPWLKDFHFPPKLNEPDDSNNDQIWKFCMVYHTSYI